LPSRRKYRVAREADSKEKAVIAVLPYCGAAPLPGELLTRFNPDPVLIAALILAMTLQLWRVKALSFPRRAAAIAGWLAAAIALMSPLCALSVALFSARVAQHMMLILIAAPLIALGMPVQTRRAGWPLWISTLIFFLGLWFWHMPRPYGATFSSVAVYWCMHLSLFGGAIWLWRELLQESPANTAQAFVAGALTSVQMGLLGAVLSLADHSLFPWHLTTTWAWSLTPLEDQQLGGVIMWVPGIALFLWVAVRSLARLWSSFEGARAA
jgi:putative membrane protein